MKRPRRRKSPKPTEGDVVVWDDPEWQPALNAIEGYQPDGTYTGKSNLKPLAKLLQSGKPVPNAVAVTIGGLLDPPWGKRGPRLVLLESARYSAAKDSAYVKEMMKLQRLIEAQQRQTPKLEAAIAAVALQTKISRSKLMQAWSWDLDKSILKLGKFNPHSYLSPRESGKS